MGIRNLKKCNRNKKSNYVRQRVRANLKDFWFVALMSIEYYCVDHLFTNYLIK